jgi:hypothetical protein
VKKVASLLEPVEDNSSLVRDYHTHDQMMEVIDKLAADHPNLLKRYLKIILKVQKQRFYCLKVFCYYKERSLKVSIQFFSS